MDLQEPHTPSVEESPGLGSRAMVASSQEPSETNHSTLIGRGHILTFV